ncbi:MAG: hypothetical protein IPL32_01790 [Chloracidobacterium sp.]|nr:hypothetical protein [Chloracidobacterium sp.]
MREINANINSQIYLGQFQRDIGGHISDFRNVLRTIEDESFVGRSQQKGPEAIVHIQAPNASLRKDDATQRAIDNCFLAMMRSVVSFMDRIIATKRADGKPILNVPVGTVVGEELLPFIETHLEQFYREVAEDTSLTNPKKVSTLDGIPDWIGESLRSMFAVRRALEHHRGVSKQELTLALRRMRLTVGEREIGKLPMHVKGGEQLMMQVVEANTVFPSNSLIMLSELDIENLFFTLQSIIGPAILQTLNKAKME